MSMLSTQTLRKEAEKRTPAVFGPFVSGNAKLYCARSLAADWIHAALRLVVGWSYIVRDVGWVAAVPGADPRRDATQGNTQLYDMFYDRYKIEYNLISCLLRSSKIDHSLH